MKKLLHKLEPEEKWNVLTHGAGLLLGIVMTPLLFWSAYFSQWQDATAGVLVFCCSVAVLYACSTLYHAQHVPERKAFFQKLDHIAIYVLIAGSYTPFLMLYFQDTQLYLYLGLMWGIALMGTVYKLFFLGRFKLFSVALYLIMGWMVVLIGGPIFERMNQDALNWLFAGGLAYSSGVLFFLWERLPFSHAIWHLFVLGGTLSHGMSLYTIFSH